MEELVKQLAMATVQLQQSMVVQQKATEAQLAALREATTAQAAALRDSTEAQSRMLAEAVQQLAQGQGKLAVAPSNQVTIRASHFLQKLTPSDDIEAFLTTFERTAEREGWPAEQWAGIVAPFLTGDPQKAYFDLPPERANVYSHLKAEILARLGVTTAVRAQRIHSWRYRPDMPPRSQMHDLIQLAKKWLQPDTLSGPQMVERVVMDRYLRALPSALQRWVSHGDPKTADQLVDMVERFTVVEDLLGPAKRREAPAQRLGKTSSTPRVGAARDPGTSMDNRASTRSALPPKASAVQCWRCQAWGHTMAHCPLQEEPMQCDTAQRVSFYAQVVCTARPDNDGQFGCMVQVNGVPSKALLDSGSMVTLVRAQGAMRTDPAAETLRVICIHGDTREYPLVPASIATGCGTLMHKVGVVPLLPHDIVIGRDFPLFSELWRRTECTSSDVLPNDVESDSSIHPELEGQMEGSLSDDLGTGCPGAELLSEGGEPSPLQVMAGERREGRGGCEENGQQVTLATSYHQRNNQPSVLRPAKQWFTALCDTEEVGQRRGPAFVF